jgi:uncharacterized protein YeeX (DUF496 family)
MKFNEESFKKALSECKIIRWQNIFKQVVKAYLKEEEKQLTLTDVSQRSELLLDFLNVTSPSMSIDDKHAIINAYKRNKSNNCG